MTRQMIALFLLLLTTFGLSACSDSPTQVPVPQAADPAAAVPDPRFLTFPWGLNQYESALLAANPWLIDCTKNASTKALQFTAEYARKRGITTVDGYRANAFQHTVWNILLAKECGWAYSTVSGAENWARAFADAHERGTPNKSPLREMDFHNNARGREIFRQYAYTYFQGIIRRVGWQDEVFLKAVVSSKTDKAVRFTYPSELGRYPTSLVFVLGR